MNTEQANTEPTQTTNSLVAFNGVSAEAAVDELRRELHVRNKCYPKWTEEGKLTHAEAKSRLDGMVAALDFCAWLESLKSSVSSEYATWSKSVQRK
jgi:hypothetical protein